MEEDAGWRNLQGVSVLNIAGKGSGDLDPHLFSKKMLECVLEL